MCLEQIIHVFPLFAQRYRWGYTKGDEIIFFTMINTIEARQCSQKHATQGVENQKIEQIDIHKHYPC